MDDLAVSLEVGVFYGSSGIHPVLRIGGYYKNWLAMGSGAFIYNLMEDIVNIHAGVGRSFY